jgi:hypothetical protein
MFRRNSKRAARALGMSMVSAAAVLAQMLQQAPAQPPPTGNASVSGAVANSVTGAAVPHAQVTVIVLGRNSGQSFRTVTDGEGKFTIGGLPPGRLMVNVDRVGFVDSGTGSRLSDVQLVTDEKKENLKLTLTPTGGVSGRVLNAEGAAVQGAIVSLEGAPFSVNPTTTDEKGQFRISSVPPGKYRVCANPAVLPFPPEIRTDGTREVHYARTYYPDSLTGKGGQRIEVGGGADVMGIDIRLVRTPIVTLRGRVVGVPAGGKTVVYAMASAAAGGFEQSTNHVKADGSFELWQLDPGIYTVVATNTSAGSGLQGSMQSTPVEIEAAGVDIEHVELRMIPPFDVGVQVGFDDAKAREAPPMPAMPARQGAGQPQAAPRQPMPRRMMLQPDGRTFVNSYQTVEIGADDSFTLEKLQPGRYRLAPTWGVYVKSVTAGSTETEGDILDLRNGPAGAVKVTVASLTGEVSGVVSDANGPAAEAVVMLIADRSPARRPMFARTAADGTYKFPAVPPGKYKMVAGDNDLAMQFQSGRDAEEYDGVAESIEVHADDKVSKPLKKVTAGR